MPREYKPKAKMKRSTKIILITAIVTLSIGLGSLFTGQTPQEWFDRPTYTSDEVIAQVKRFLPYSFEEEIVSISGFNTSYESKGKWYGRCVVEYKVTIEKLGWGYIIGEGHGPYSSYVEEVHQTYLGWYFYEKSQTLEILSQEPITPILKLRLPPAEDTWFPIYILLTYPYTSSETIAQLYEDGEIWAEGNQIAILNLQTGEYIPTE